MKKITAKIRIIMLSAMLGGTLISARDGHAVASDPCTQSAGNYLVADGDSCTVDLTQSNVDLFDNHILVRLLINNPSSGHTTIRLSLESAPAGLTLLGFDRFGLNGSILAAPIGWSACGPHAPFNISGFGDFTEIGRASCRERV